MLCCAVYEKEGWAWWTHLFIEPPWLGMEHLWGQDGALSLMGGQWPECDRRRVGCNLRFARFPAGKTWCSRSAAVALRVVIWPYTASLGPSHWWGALQVVLGPFALSLGLKRCRWAHRIVGGPYMSSLGLTRRCLALHVVSGCFTSSLGPPCGRLLTEGGSWRPAIVHPAGTGRGVVSVRKGRGKMGHDKVMARFCDAPWPPISWVPPCVPPPVSPGRAVLNRPTSL